MKKRIFKTFIIFSLVFILLLLSTNIINAQQDFSSNQIQNQNTNLNQETNQNQEQEKEQEKINLFSNFKQETIEQASLESTPMIYDGTEDSEYISNNELIKLAEGESAIKEAYRVKLTVRSISSNFVDIDLNFHEKETYFDRNLDLDYTGCENTWEPQIKTFSEPFEGQNLRQAAQVLYRSHFYCNGETDTSRVWHGCSGELTDGRQIIDLRAGYNNFGCGNRYYEHCILDGTYDAYYFESCDYGWLRFKIGEEKQSSEFKIKLISIEEQTNEENGVPLRYAVFQFMGEEDIFSYGRTDNSFAKVKFYNQEQEEKLMEVKPLENSIELESNNIIADVADTGVRFSLKENNLFLEKNNERKKIEVTPSDAVNIAIGSDSNYVGKPEVSLDIENNKAIYKVKTEEEARFILFIFGREVEASVDAESGEISNLKKQGILSALFS